MPRNIVGPVVRGDDFWGRERVVDRAWELVDRGSVLLTGPRRHGKTSLMCAMHDRPRPGWTVVHMDVEFVLTAAEFATELAAALLQQRFVGAWLRRAKGFPASVTRWVQGVFEHVEVGIENVGSAKVQLREALAEGTQWPDLARQLLDTLHGFDGRVLVIIDEFPMMVASMLHGNEVDAIRFLRWFRALRQPSGPRNVTFLLGGSVNIEPLLARLGQESLINDLQRLPLEPLAPEQARELVRAVFAHEGLVVGIDVTEAVVKRVGAGVPFYLQLVIAECIADPTRPITAATVDRAYRERVLGPYNRNRFQHHESRLRSYYGGYEHRARAVLAALATGTKSDDALHELVDDGSGPSDFDQLMTLLEADHYVVREAGTCRFVHDILRDWWFHHGNMPTGRRAP